MSLPVSHPDFWTRALQFTPTIHRDVYPAVEASNPAIGEIACGKVVVVTGAGSGFGRGVCVQWAKAGASGVVLAGRRREMLEVVAREIKSINADITTFAVTCDTSKERDVETLFDSAIENFGGIDVLVHCAGVLGPVTNIGDSAVGEWWKAFEINAKGAYLVARALISRTKQGASASFINCGTAASYFPNPGQSSYTMSKLAVNMLLDQLHVEYPNLRVFNVHPGMAKSNVLRPELEIYAKDTPELFGSCTIYLSGSAADFLRGRFIVANWDVDELVKYKDAIINDGLLKNQPFKGDIGNGGHFARASDHA